MSETVRPWPPLANVADGAWHGCTVGPLVIRVRRMDDEWHAVCDRDEESEKATEPPTWQPVDAPDEGVEIKRWLVGDPLPLAIVPAMPDRPVVVRPAAPLILMPGASGSFFVSIPVWVRFGIEADGSLRQLHEFPTVVLSNTWYGTPFDGILAYALRTLAHRALENLLPRRHRAICAIEIVNRWAEPVLLERLCIHAENLAIYAGTTRLWTTAVRCILKNPAEPSVIEFADAPPDGRGAGGLITPARSPQRSGLLRWMRG